MVNMHKHIIIPFMCLVIILIVCTNSLFLFSVSPGAASINQHR